MNEQKHTPGPWALESVNSEALHDIALGYHVPGAGSPLLIASTYDDEEEDAGRPGYISTFEAEANARLIAAAPDLLAACKELLDLADCDPREIGGVEKLVKDRARAAIAKAEGNP